MPHHITLEICIDSVESALAAVQGRADRVELCQNLFEGGTTPSAGMIDQVRAAIPIPLFVMIRPRGGDFLYSSQEFEVMKRDIAQAKNSGADGVVLGLLNRQGRVDRKRTALLVRLARPLEVTFHRAFDMTRDPFEALDDLKTLGIERLLTSGQEKSAWEGADLISRLARRAKNQIKIMPGGGINERNFPRIAQLTRAREFHVSASEPVQSPMLYQSNRCFMGRELRPPEFSWFMASARRIRALRNLAKPGLCD
jgi:copper homeostasis protein